MGGVSIATQKATIHTNRGDIVIELYGNHAPEMTRWKIEPL